MRFAFVISTIFARTLLPDRLTWIDETNRGEHHFLEEDDQCLFFGEFNSGKGWRGGPTNQLIANLKRKPTQIAASPNSQQLQYYKKKAINEVALAVRKQFSAEQVTRVTFVPVPPSKVPGDPDYCDRLERILRQAFPRSMGYAGLDVRLLLHQKKSTVPDHLSGGSRLRYEELLDITELDKSQLAYPVRKLIILFDDVLTSGKHYKVGKTRIQEHLLGQKVIGLFIARAIHPNPFDEFN